MSVWIDLLIRIGFAWLALRLAQKRGRDPIFWTIATVFFIFPLLILAILPPVKKKPGAPDKAPEDIFQGETVEVKPLSKGDQAKESSNLSFESVSWYQLGKERKSEGPLTFSEMQRRFWEGDLTEETYVWTPEWKDWKKIGAVPGLLSAFSK